MKKHLLIIGIICLAIMPMNLQAQPEMNRGEKMESHKSGLPHEKAQPNA